MPDNPFELLELPDGRWCVARIAAATHTLIAGSFASLAPSGAAIAATSADPVGIFPSRDAAERAIQRERASPQDPLAPFAPWLRQR